MAKKNRSWLRFLCIASLALLAFPPGCIAWQLFVHNNVREHVRISVPGTAVSLEHSRLAIHPMMAEYSRDVSFVRDGNKTKTLPLEIDTCGGYPINCYLVNAPSTTAIRLDDAVSEHLIDLDRKLVYLVVRVGGKAYFGNFNGDDSSIHITSFDSEDPMVSIGDKPADKLDSLTGGVDELYIGRITGKAGRLRFLPADEHPEKPIKKLHEW